MKKQNEPEIVETSNGSEVIPDFFRANSRSIIQIDNAESTSSGSSQEIDTEDKWGKGQEKITFQNRVSVFDVASYILESCGAMSTMKLQKLTYYCHVWSLVWDEQPLFSEDIEAWANGPVIRDLFNYHRGHYQIDQVIIGNSDKLSRVQKETIDSVIKYYGNKSAQWLIDLSHMEDPWKNARMNMDNMERGSKIISLESIAEYYTSL